jgi:hypothetical protein
LPRAAPAEEDRPFKQKARHGRVIWLEFPDYSIKVDFGDGANGVGITILGMSGQKVGFCSRVYALADWEWLTFKDDSGDQVACKLLENQLDRRPLPPWTGPELSWAPPSQTVRLGAVKRDIHYPGLDLEISCQLSADQPEFDIIYSIRNGSGHMLRGPQVMVGLPGFPHHEHLVAVGNGAQTRKAAAPFRTLREEAEAIGHDYALLGVPPQRGPSLVGEAFVEDEDGSLRVLEASYTPDANVRSARSGWVNKPTYATGHLYLELADISPGEVPREIRIHYRLYRADARPDGVRAESDVGPQETVAEPGAECE